MKIVRKVSEDEMISVFLQAEYNSKRFKKNIKKLLKEKWLSSKIISKPNLNSPQENSCRNAILTDYRGWGTRTELFNNFPNKIKWFLVSLAKEELLKVKYIDYDYWNKLSDSTRLATVAAKNIKANKVIFDVSNENFVKASEALAKGKEFPMMILVTKDKESDLVVLEGHLRLTAFALDQSNIPGEIAVILGISKEITKWGLY